MPEELLNAGPISRTTCRDQRRSLSDGIAYAKAVRAREPIMTGASSVSRGYGRRRGSTSLQSETPAGAMAWAKPPSASAGASRLSANGRCRYPPESCRPAKSRISATPFSDGPPALCMKPCLAPGKYERSIVPPAR